MNRTQKGCLAAILTGVVLIAGIMYFFVNYNREAALEYRNQERRRYSSSGESTYINDKYARAFEELDDYEAQKELTDDYLDRYPDSRTGMGNRAYLLIENGEYQAGIFLNQEVLYLHGGSDATYNNIGWAYNNLDLYEIALYYLEKAVAENDGELTYSETVNLGDAYQGLEDYERAIEYYQIAMDDFADEDAKNNYYAYDELAYTYREAGRDADALETNLKLLKLDTTNLYAFQDAIAIYQEQEDIRAILKLGKRFCSDNPDVNHAYYSMASTLYDMELYKTAAEYYIQYAENTTYSSYGYYMAAESYVLAGKQELAKEYVDILLEGDPDYADYLSDEELWGWLNE